MIVLSNCPIHGRVQTRSHGNCPGYALSSNLQGNWVLYCPEGGQNVKLLGEKIHNGGLCHRNLDYYNIFRVTVTFEKLHSNGNNTQEWSGCCLSLPWLWSPVQLDRGSSFCHELVQDFLVEDRSKCTANYNEVSRALNCTRFAKYLGKNRGTAQRAAGTHKNHGSAKKTIW